MSITAFELMAKLGLDKKEYDDGLNEAENSGKSAGSGIGSALGGAAKVGLTAVTAAVGAAATGLTVMGKQAVQQYAQYEQLVGGVEKLYGDAADKVQEYANQAFLTSGMSANTYMETATQFSASLINSLGGDMNAAADMTDVAMKAMSDNVNVFGSDMESVSNAFKGFSKQNYTMLDNLKLGYGGTKEEMERLIADANEWGAANGKASDLSIDSFADVVTAIQQIQEKQGIAGTTQAEAMKTLEGSATAAKAAWENVITAIAGGGDLESAFSGLMTTLFGGEDGGGLLANLIPRVQQTMEGIGNFVANAGPYITDKLPELVNAVLPGLLESAVALVNALIGALPGIIQGLFDQIPMLLTSLVDMIVTLAPMVVQLGVSLVDSLLNGILEALPSLMSGADSLIDTLVEMLSDPTKLSEMLNTAVEIVTTLADGLVQALPELIPAVIGIITGLVTTLTEPDRITQLVTAALDIIMALADGIIKALPVLIAAIPTIIENIIMVITNSLPQILEAGVSLLIFLIKGIVQTIPQLVAMLPQIIFSIVTGLINLGGRLLQAGVDLFVKIKDGFFGSIEGAKDWGKDLIDNFINGLKERWENLKKTVKDIAQSIKDLLGFSEPKLGPLSNFHTYAPDMMDLFAKGIKDNAKKVTGAIEENITLPTTKGVKGSITNSEDNGIIDYSEMANAVALAFEKSGLAVEIDNREFGRVVRKVVTV